MASDLEENSDLRSGLRNHPTGSAGPGPCPRSPLSGPPRAAESAEAAPGAPLPAAQPHGCPVALAPANRSRAGRCPGRRSCPRGPQPLSPPQGRTRRATPRRGPTRRPRARPRSRRHGPADVSPSGASASGGSGAAPARGSRGGALLAGMRRAAPPPLPAWPRGRGAGWRVVAAQRSIVVAAGVWGLRARPAGGLGHRRSGLRVSRPRGWRRSPCR